MNRNQKAKTIIAAITLLLVIIVGAIGSYLVIPILWISDDEELRDDYNKEIENCRILQEVSKSVIVPKTGMLVGNINNEKICYEISNNGENIQFYYYIRYIDGYNASIILSKDYEIIEEKYSKLEKDMEPFEEYAKESKKISNILTIFICLLGLLTVAAFAELIYKSIIDSIEKRNKK